MSEIVISVEGLGKKYQLGTIGYGTLRHDLQAWIARRRGKDDPNSQIGTARRPDLHGDFWALKDINFSIEKGGRVGIIGRNGAGKSTILKILSQITRPTEGIIRIKGRIASLLEIGTGFHPELTGRENIFLNGAIMGMKRREILRKFDEIVEFSGVEKFIDTPVKRYSSGMYVRLGFSVAAHLESDIMIVDEVLAVGDSNFQKKCIAKMYGLSTKDGRTIIFVSHNMRAISTVCSTGILLSNGKIISQGSMHEQVKKYLEIGTSDASSEEIESSDISHACITRIGVQSDLGTWKNEFAIGEDVLAIMDITVPKSETAELMAAVRIETSEGIPLANVIEIDGNNRMMYGFGRFRIAVKFQDVRLYPDTYYLSFWLGDRESNTIHCPDNRIKLTIIDGGKLTKRTLPRDAGLFFFTPIWRIESA